MKIWKTIVLAVVTVILIFGILALDKQRRSYETQREQLEQKVNGLKTEQETLKSSIEYYAKPENLLKEAESQFYFKKSGENLVIIVPSLSTSTSSSTTASSVPSQGN